MSHLSHPAGAATFAFCPRDGTPLVPTRIDGRDRPTCPVCGFAFEREPGYYTGAVAINLVVSELLIVIIAVPLAASQLVSPIYLIILGCTLPVLLPILFYRPTKSLWMSLDHFLHPVSQGEL